MLSPGRHDLVGAGSWLVVSLLLWRVTVGSRTAWLACLVLTAGGAVLFGCVAVAAALPGGDVDPAARAGSLAGAYALGTLALPAAPVRARVRGEVPAPQEVRVGA